MKILKTVSCLIFFMSTLAIGAQAHPPSEITLTYDLESSSLSVDMAHVTQDTYDHFIRSLETRVNAGEPINVYHNQQQSSPTNALFSVNVAAEEGDMISVKASCSEGGTKAASLELPKEEAEEDEEEEVEQSDLGDEEEIEQNQEEDSETEDYYAY